MDIRTLYSIAILLLIVGGLNYGYLLLAGSSAIQQLFGLFMTAYGAATLTRIVYGLIAIAALALMFRRDTYLPFLGETVAPVCNILAERIPEGANVEIKVRVAPGARVLYWAAEPAADGLKHATNWREAYAQYKNAGVTVADVRGNAILKVRSPQPYTVPLKGQLEPHVHYRVCQQDGMMSRIETVFITDAGVIAA